VGMVELTRAGNIVGMPNSADLSSDSGVGSSLTSVLLHPLPLSNYCDSKKEVLVRRLLVAPYCRFCSFFLLVALSLIKMLLVSTSHPILGIVLLL